MALKFTVFKKIFFSKKALIFATKKTTIGYL